MRLLLLALLIPAAFGQAEFRYSINVAVQVSADNGLDSRLTSLIVRGLESLDGVHVVQSEPRYRVRVVMVRYPSFGMYAAAAVVTAPLTWIKNDLSGSEDYRNAVAAGESLEGQSIMSDVELPALADQIIAWFHTDFLLPGRDAAYRIFKFKAQHPETVFPK